MAATTATGQPFVAPRLSIVVLPFANLSNDLDQQYFADQLGRTEEAKEALEKAIAVAPASFDMYVRGRVPWMRPEDHAHMIEGLRKAGWEA